MVHSFWELRTEETLPENFHLHALSDACLNILFNQADTRVAGVTALRTSYEVLDLGTEFHYVGIQFLPGVWQVIRPKMSIGEFGWIGLCMETEGNMVGLSSMK